MNAMALWSAFIQRKQQIGFILILRRKAKAMIEYKLVPIEPTEEMCLAGAANLDFDYENGSREQLPEDARNCWKDMLSAAPPIQPIDVEKLKREVTDKYIEHSNGNCDQCSYEAVSWAIDNLSARFNITKKGE